MIVREVHFDPLNTLLVPLLGAPRVRVSPQRAPMIVRDVRFDPLNAGFAARAHCMLEALRLASGLQESLK